MSKLMFILKVIKIFFILKYEEITDYFKDKFVTHLVDAIKGLGMAILIVIAGLLLLLILLFGISGLGYIGVWLYEFISIYQPKGNNFLDKFFPIGFCMLSERI